MFLLPEELPALFPGQLIVQRSRSVILIRIVWRKGGQHKSVFHKKHGLIISTLHHDILHHIVATTQIQQSVTSACQQNLTINSLNYI